MYIYAIVYIHYTPMNICCCVLTLKWINMKMYGKLSGSRKKTDFFLRFCSFSRLNVSTAVAASSLWNFFSFRLDVVAMQKFVIQLSSIENFRWCFTLHFRTETLYKKTLFVTKLIDGRFSHSSDKRILSIFFFLFRWSKNK